MLRNKTVSKIPVALPSMESGGGVFMTFYIWKWNLIRDVLFPYYCSVALCVISAFPKHNCMWGFYIPPVEGVERHGDR